MDNLPKWSRVILAILLTVTFPVWGLAMLAVAPFWRLGSFFYAWLSGEETEFRD